MISGNSKHRILVLFFIILYIFNNKPLYAGETNTTFYPVIKDWPDLREIVNSFYLYYTTDSLQKNEYIKFARTPKGWYLMIVNYKTNTFSKELFWDAGIMDYVELSVPYLEEESLEQNSASIAKKIEHAKGDSAFFFHNLYYGYKDWENDVISALEQHYDLLDNRYKCYLARAYSSLGRKIIAPNFNETVGYYSPFDSTFDKNKINPNLVDTFLDLSLKAAEAYMEIYESDPDFVSFTGKIKTVLSNECMTAFLQLSMLDEKEYASKFLIDNLYAPFLISLGKEYLYSCDSNSVIFTDGDSDTYLLLYIQNKFHFRTDITVICKPLTSWGRYIHYLTSYLPENNAIKLSLPIDMYKLNNNGYVYLKPSDTIENLSIKTIIDEIKTNSGTFETYHNRYILPVNEFTHSFQNQTCLDTALTHNKNVSWNIDNNYILKLELFFWDFLVTSEQCRPVYFYTSVENYHLHDYIIPSGLLYKLMPFDQYTNPDTSSTLLKIKFDTVSLTKDLNKIKFDFWIGQIKYAYYKNIKYYVDLGKTNISLSLLDEVTTVFSNKFCNFNDIDLFFAYYYIQLSEPESGKYLMSIMFLEQINVFIDLVKNFKIDNEKEVVDAIRFIKDIYSELEKNFSRREIKSYRKLLEKVEDYYNEL